MPALPPVPKACRVVLNGLIQGTKPWVNAFHLGYSVGAAMDATEVLNVATAVAGAWGTNMAPIMSDTLSLLNVICTALDSSSAPEALVPAAVPGTVTLPPVAGGTAMVIQRKIARRYRGGHSRIYLGGMVDANLDDTELTWDATAAADFATQWESIEGAGNTVLTTAGHSDSLPISVSYYEFFTNVLYPSGRYHVKPTLRATPLKDNVFSYEANPRPCSQRRRQQP